MKFIIKTLKNHYILTIIFPILFVLNWMAVLILDTDQTYPDVKRFFVYFEISLALLFVFSLFLFLVKKKYMDFFGVLVIPSIFIFILLNQIDSDKVYFLFHKNYYLYTIKNSPSIATDGGAKLVKIPIKGAGLACEKHLVYDETDEIENPNGNFRGIDYLYTMDLTGNKYKIKAYNTKVKNIEEHIYIVYTCQDIGQRKIISQK